MIKEVSIVIQPEKEKDENFIQKEICLALKKQGISFEEKDISTVFVKKSIDARHRNIKLFLRYKVYIGENPSDEFALPEWKTADGKRTVAIIGSGPAGLFGALKLLEHGVRPVVIERGSETSKRKRDIAMISTTGIVDENSNYCFGEGGAGTFSDGKLYTRSNKRGNINGILKIFEHFGADKKILTDAHPHIGTDKLPEVIKNMRETILRAGGEIHFSTRVTDIIIDGNEARGVITADGREYLGPVIIATGHSARDIYRMLDAKGVAMTPKGIAVGVRLEHPQRLIDQIQYHSPEGRGRYLPAAEYSMLTRVDDRAVYSFCMCPGGFIIPAASDGGQLVVNGMSPSNRGTKWANSGMVVEVLPEDLPEYDRLGSLKMMGFQEDIEKRFFEASGHTQQAPAQRMVDFTNGRLSTSLPDTSYAPGIIPARIDQLLPPRIAKRLQKGFVEFGRKSRGFLTNEAVLIGDETRTSSPVQINRDKETLCHTEIKNLYPCGEGAGFAGGIVSAAIDGIRCAESIAAGR